MAWSLFILGLLLLGGALWLSLRARRGQQRSGLPQGKLVYADTGRWSAVARPFFSPRYRLTGKPDYLVEGDEGIVPVEVKHTAAPAGGVAYESHVMQLAAYCLLIEEAHGQTPPYGLIRYDDATVQIEYDAGLRRRLLALMEEMRASRNAAGVLRSHRLALMEEMRASRNAAGVLRSHREAARCRACGVRHACGVEVLD